MFKYIIILCFIIGSVLQVSGQTQTTDSIPAKNPASVKLIERLYGVWKTTGSLDGQNNAVGQASESIEFNPEAKYILRRGDQVVETGSYRVNEQHSIVYLERGTDKNPTEWRVKLSGNNLTLTSRRSGDQPTVTYTKVPGADSGTLDEPR